MKQFLPFLLLSAASAFSQNYQCSSMTYTTQQLNQPPACFLLPASFDVGWNHVVTVTNTTTGGISSQTTASTTGVGLCSCIPGTYCANGAPSESINVTSNGTTWTWVDTVTSAAPSGLMGGCGCLGGTTSHNYMVQFPTVQCPCVSSTCGLYGCPSCCATGYCNGICMDYACPYSYTAYCVNGSITCHVNGSPIIIDWDGSGIHLTTAEGGIMWTFFPAQAPVQVAWIDRSSTNAFLVYDRNGNGIIDNASEMFGNLTPQPPSAKPNGFLALAEFDSNGDGIINAKDTNWSKLQVMRADFSLHSLAEYGIKAISLNYQPADARQNGNIGEFKSFVNTTDAGRVTVAYDWFLNFILPPGSGTPASALNGLTGTTAGAQACPSPVPPLK